MCARVRELFVKHHGLHEAKEKWPWLELMMARVMVNKLRPAKEANAKLCNLSNKQAELIGAALASYLAANLTAHAAVDEWILHYPAMKELDHACRWFRPMMDIVGKRLFESVSWGLKSRLYMGAGLSILDMASDVNVALLYARHIPRNLTRS
jgi:hypothetical protein